MTRVAKPLKGHDFHTKSDASLRWIIKDASDAAECMQLLGNEKGEAKYRDQVNDACTVLAYRRTITYRRLNNI
jgi:hypothetical protein